MENLTANTFSVYPNPTSESAILDLKLQEKGVVTIRVFNSLGQSISTLIHNVEMESGRYEISIPENFERGIYIIEVVINQNQSTRKFVKL